MPPLSSPGYRGPLAPYDLDEYDSEYDSEDGDLGAENYDVLNDGPEQPRGDWVKDPIQMGGDQQSGRPVAPTSWDEFDAQYTKPFLTPEEERKKELELAKQEYFEELKREADFKKAHPEFDEEKANDEKLQAERKLAENPDEWKDLTPAKRQLKENERHFAELQELKKAREGEDYKLPMPVKPESMKFTPSSDHHDAHMKDSDERVDKEAPEKELTDGPSSHEKA